MRALMQCMQHSGCMQPGLQHACITSSGVVPATRGQGMLSCPELWSEFALFERLLYKSRSQHRGAPFMGPLLKVRAVRAVCTCEMWVRACVCAWGGAGLASGGGVVGMGNERGGGNGGGGVCGVVCLPCWGHQLLCVVVVHERTNERALPQPPAIKQ